MANPLFEEKTPPRDSEEVLILTNKRTSQQYSPFNSALSRQKNKGKLLVTRSIPSLFCGREKYIRCSNKNGKRVLEEKTYFCKSYYCPRCQPWLIMKLKYLFKEVIQLNTLDHLLTLTLDPKKIPYEYLNENGNYTHRYITKLFNHFLVTLKRKINKDIKYAWVCEFQKNGNAHLHVVVNRFLPIETIKRYWTRIGGGHDMKIEIVKNIYTMDSYLIKYLVKGFNKNESSNGFRGGEKRYSISQSCKRVSKEEKRKVLKVDKNTDLKGILNSEEIAQVYNALEIK